MGLGVQWFRGVGDYGLRAYVTGPFRGFQKISVQGPVPRAFPWAAGTSQYGA